MYTMIFRGNETKHTQNFDKNENITNLLKILGKRHMCRIFMTSIQWKNLHVTIYIAYRVV